MRPAYLTAEQFRGRVLTSEHSALIDECILCSTTPYAFRDAPGDYDILRNHIARGLGVAQEGIALIGSGRVGFSPHPDKYGAPFGDESDLDMLIVSSDWFDQMWLELLRWHNRNQVMLSKEQKRVLERVKHELYWGRLWPSDLSFATSTSAQWFETFKSVGRFSTLAKWEVSGRLYRTWEHARLYQLWSLSRLKLALTPSQST